MKKLEVRFMTDNSNFFSLGKLIEVNSKIYFEYDKDFIKTGFELSPFFLPLKEGTFEHKDFDFGPIWGLFDDSLPDGWGLLLLDRYFRKQGHFFSNLNPLEKLAYLGSKTMGSLTYFPPSEEEKNYDSILNLQQLSENANEIISGSEKEILPLLLKAGGSPGGARPKIVTGFNLKTGILISGEDSLPSDFEHWLIKFNSKEDSVHSAKIEFAYSMLAVKAGINLPETRLFDGLEPKCFFGIKRFDRKQNNQRLHIHTFGNLIHSNFRIPTADYNDLLKVTKILTKNHQAVEEMFRRMVFNIFTNNRDDHVKNFSFIYDHSNLSWNVSPAYDLTFSEGPAGEHSMTINGKGKNITQENVFAVASKAGITDKRASLIIDQVKNALEKWKNVAEIAEIPQTTAIELKKIFNKNLF